MKKIKVGGYGIGLGTLLALIVSALDNIVGNNHNLELGMQVIWVAINTVCSWFYIISYFITHLP